MFNRPVTIENADGLGQRKTGAETPPKDPCESGSVVASPSPVRYGVLGGLCVIATIAYIQRNSLGIAESSIREELGLSKGQMGS